MMQYVQTLLIGSLLSLVTLLFLAYNGYGLTRLFLNFHKTEKTQIAFEVLALPRFSLLLMPLFGLIYLIITGSLLLIFVASMSISAWILLGGATLLNLGVVWKERGVRLGQLNLKAVLISAGLLGLTLAINLTPMAVRGYLTVTSKNIDSLNSYLPLTQFALLDKATIPQLTTANRGSYVLYGSLSVFTGLDIYRLISSIVTATLICGLMAAFLFYLTTFRHSVRLAVLGVIFLIIDNALSWTVFFALNARILGTALLITGIMALVWVYKYPELHRFKLIAISTMAASASVYMPTTSLLAIMAAGLLVWKLGAGPRRFDTVKFVIIYGLGAALLALPHTLNYLTDFGKWVSWLSVRPLAGGFSADFFFDWGEALGNGSFPVAWHTISAMREWLDTTIPSILNQTWWHRLGILSQLGTVCLALLFGLGSWRLLRSNANRYLIALALPILIYLIWLRYIVAYTYGFFAATGYVTFLIFGFILEGIAFSFNFSWPESKLPKFLKNRQLLQFKPALLVCPVLLVVMLTSSAISLAQNVADSRYSGYTPDLRTFADFTKRIPPNSSVAFLDDYSFYQALYAWNAQKLALPEKERAAFGINMYFMESQASPIAAPGNQPLSYAPDYMIYRVNNNAKEPFRDEHNFYNLVYRWQDLNWKFDQLIYQRPPGLVARRLLQQSGQNIQISQNKPLILSANARGIYLTNNGEQIVSGPADAARRQLSLMLQAEIVSSLELKIMDAQNQPRQTLTQKLEAGLNFVVSPPFSENEKLMLEIKENTSVPVFELGLWNNLPAELSILNRSNLALQLRVTPDRVVANDATNSVTYSFTLKNNDTLQVPAGKLILPIPAQLVFREAGFADSRLSLLATNDGNLSVTIPALSKNETVKGTIVFQPNPANPPTPGEKLALRYTFQYNDVVGYSHQKISNEVNFAFGPPGSNENEGGGNVQQMNPPQLESQAVGKLTFTAGFFVPLEIVDTWITRPDGSSQTLSRFKADENGKVSLTLDVSKLAPGSYVVAAYGASSSVTGSSILVIKP